MRKWKWGYNRISCDIPEDIEAIQYLGTTGFGVSHFHTNLVLGWRNKNGKSTPAISSEPIPSPRNLMRVQSEEPALISDIHWRFEISQNMVQDKGTLSEERLVRLVIQPRKIC